jgi:serine/threonine-protein kinase HipA
MDKKTCAVEMFVGGHWQEIASVLLLGDVAGGWRTKTYSGYDDGWAIEYEGRRDGCALCSDMPVQLSAYEFNTWPPFLVDLLPQGFGRRELLRRLGLPETLEAAGDWRLLLAGAGNPVGHLRIKEAAEWLEQNSGSKEGFTDDEVAQRGEEFIEHLGCHGLFVAGSSGVQGEWPKVMLTRASDGLLYLDHTVPDHEAVEHFIVKFGRGENKSLAQILRHEAPYMEVARKLGLDVFKSLTIKNNALFIPRFDRYVKDGRVMRLAQESIAVLTGQIGFEGVPTHDKVCCKLAEVSSAPFIDIVEYLKRDVANLAMGNKDNHARNTAVQRDFYGNIRLTPLFDFTPMYLHPDGIARRIRWECERLGPVNWNLVLDAVANNTGIDRNELVKNLKEMVPSLEEVRDKGEEFGIEKDVLDFLRRSIQTQIDNLALL